MNLALLAQDAPTKPPAGPLSGLLDMLPMLAVIWLIFWFLVFRPQKKQQQALKDRLAGLKKGDQVRTRGGILGVITNVRDGEVLIRADNDGKVRLRIAKEFIEDVSSKDGGDADTKK